VRSPGNWMESLVERYDSLSVSKNATTRPAPMYHCGVKSHLHISLFNSGGQIQIHPAYGEEWIHIPCTEKTETRTNGNIQHPLHENLKYVCGLPVKAKMPQPPNMPVFNSGIQTARQVAFLRLLDWAKHAAKNNLNVVAGQLETVARYLKGAGGRQESHQQAAQRIFSDIYYCLSSGGLPKPLADKPSSIFVRWSVDGCCLWLDRDVSDSWRKYVEETSSAEKAAVQKFYSPASGMVDVPRDSHPKLDEGKIFSVPYSTSVGITWGGFGGDSAKWRGDRYETKHHCSAMSFSDSHKIHAMLDMFKKTGQYTRIGDTTYYAWCDAG